MIVWGVREWAMQMSEEGKSELSTEVAMEGGTQQVLAIARDKEAGEVGGKKQLKR
jgi:hypothetical protein